MTADYVSVDLQLVDNTPSANPIHGVVVRVFSLDGKTPLTEAITDDNGDASFLLLSSVTYQVRYYKFQTILPNPQYLQILDAPATNEFTAVGTPFTPPLSQDPRLCMCSGFFRTVTGAPAPNVDIQVISKFDPLIMDGSAVMNERQIARTDQNGYVQIPLIRLGQYSVVVAGMEDLRRNIAVPDSPGVNLPDLIFPVISAISFSPAGPFNLTVGVDLTVIPTYESSDQNEDTLFWDVLWSTADPKVAAAIVAGNTLTLRGFKAGTTTLIGVRANQTIIKIPDPGIAGIPQTITVT